MKNWTKPFNLTALKHQIVMIPEHFPGGQVRGQVQVQGGQEGVRKGLEGGQKGVRRRSIERKHRWTLADLL